MTLPARSFAALACVILLSPTAEAQSGSAPAPSVERYTVDSEGTCEDDKLVPFLKGNRPNIGFGYTFVTNLGAAALSRSSAARGEGISRSPKRYELVRLLGESQGSGKILVRAEDSRICGWIERQALLLSPEVREGKWPAISTRPDRPSLVFGPKPLLLKDSPLKADFPENTLSMKVVVQNVNQRGEVRKLPVYEESGSDVRRDELPFFDVFEVFDAKNENKPPNGRPGYYYLVGKQGAEDGATGKIYGWMHDADVQTWSTRIAAFWSGQVQAQGYGHQEHAQEAWKAEREKRKARFDPVYDGPAATGRPDELAIRRFPIISQYPGFGEVKTVADVNYFKVAVRGTSCKPSDKNCMGVDEIETERVRWQRVIDLMSRVDILFVIDATSSMAVYFPAVADAVRTFSQSNIREAEKINIGAVIYGDYMGGSTAKVAFERVVRMHNPITEPRLIEALARVKRIPEDATDTDLLEAPFAALIQAASTTNWRSDAGLRLIVHIADHGNRDFGKTSEEFTAANQPKSTLKETVSADMVVAALRKANVTYLPIAVAGAYNQVANTKFRKQAQDLSRAVNLIPVELRLTYDENTGVDREADRSGAVLTRLTESVDSARNTAKATEARLICERSKALDACSQVETLRRSDNWVGRFALKLSEELLPKQQIENILSRNETVTSLHFPPMRQGKDVFTYWLAMEPQVFGPLTDLFLRLCERFSRKAAAGTFFDVVQTQIRAGAGEKSLSEVYEKRFYIPAAFALDFYRKDWSELESELADRTAYAARQKQVCRTAYLLDRALVSRRVAEDSNDMG